MSSPPRQPWPAHRPSPSPLNTTPSWTTTTGHRVFFSPASSAYSSPSHSPSRGSTASNRSSIRIRSLIHSDPLLSRLTPETLYRLTADEELGFSAGEREVAIRAAEAGAKIRNWIREVEGWTKGWQLAQEEQRRYLVRKKGSAGAGPEGGEGYLIPPSSKRRRKLVLGDSAGAENTKSGTEGNVRRRLFESGDGGESGTRDSSPTPSQSPSRISSWGSSFASSYGSAGLQKRSSISQLQYPSPSSPRLSLRPTSGNSMGSGGLGEIGSPSPQKRAFPPSRLSMISEPEGEGRRGSEAFSLASDGDNTPHAESPSSYSDEEQALNSDDEDYPDAEEYWGCLPAFIVLRYEVRLEEIRTQLEDLDIEGLKSAVLSYRLPLGFPLTDPTAIITATTLQLLPPLAKLTNLLSMWAVRVALLKIVPLFLKWLGESETALETGWQRISPAGGPDQSPVEDAWRGDRDRCSDEGEEGEGEGGLSLSEEEYHLTMESLNSKIVTAGRIMDMMLDALDGQEDVLPDDWITRMEALEEGYSNWVVDGERVVLETRLRKWESEDREEVKRKMMARRDSLMWEREKVRGEAKEEEERVQEVVRIAGERVDGLVAVLGGVERAVEEVGEVVDGSENTDLSEVYIHDDDGDKVGQSLEHDGHGDEGESLLQKIERVAGIKRMSTFGTDASGDNDIDNRNNIDTNFGPDFPPRGRPPSSPHRHPPPFQASSPSASIYSPADSLRSQRLLAEQASLAEEAERQRLYLDEQARLAAKAVATHPRSESLSRSAEEDRARSPTPRSSTPDQRCTTPMNLSITTTPPPKAIISLTDTSHLRSPASSLPLSRRLLTPDLFQPPTLPRLVSTDPAAIISETEGAILTPEQRQQLEETRLVKEARQRVLAEEKERERLAGISGHKIRQRVAELQEVDRRVRDEELEMERRRKWMVAVEKAAEERKREAERLEAEGALGGVKRRGTVVGGGEKGRALRDSGVTVERKGSEETEEAGVRPGIKRRGTEGNISPLSSLPSPSSIPPVPSLGQRSAPAATAKVVKEGGVSFGKFVLGGAAVAAGAVAGLVTSGLGGRGENDEEDVALSPRTTRIPLDLDVELAKGREDVVTEGKLTTEHQQAKSDDGSEEGDTVATPIAASSQYSGSVISHVLEGEEEGEEEEEEEEEEDIASEVPSYSLSEEQSIGESGEDQEEEAELEDEEEEEGDDSQMLSSIITHSQTETSDAVSLQTAQEEFDSSFQQDESSHHEDDETDGEDGEAMLATDAAAQIRGEESERLRRAEKESFAAIAKAFEMHRSVATAKTEAERRTAVEAARRAREGTEQAERLRFRRTPQESTRATKEAMEVKMRREEEERKATEVARRDAEEEEKKRERKAEEEEAERLRKAIEKEKLAAIAKARAEAEEAERLCIAKAEEEERERLAAVARVKAEEESERLRIVEEKRVAAAAKAEEERLAAIAKAEAEERKREEAERQQTAVAAAKAEEERLAAIAEAEQRRKIAEEEEAERQRVAAKAEEERLAAIAEAEEAERRRKIAEEEAERQRVAAKVEEERLAAIAEAEEAERRRKIAEEEEAERQKVAAVAAAAKEEEERLVALAKAEAREAEKRRIAEEERIAAEAEAERLRIIKEEEERLARVKAEEEEAERQRLAAEAAAAAAKVKEEAEEAKRQQLAAAKAEEERLVAIAKAEAEAEAAAEVERQRIAEEEAERQQAAAAAKAEEDRLAVIALAEVQAEQERVAAEAERMRLLAEQKVADEEEALRLQLLEIESQQAEAKQIEMERQQLEEKPKPYDWEEAERLRQQEDRARIARLAELARLEDERVRRMDEDQRRLDMGVSTAQTDMETLAEETEDASDGSVYSRPDTPEKLDKPALLVTPSGPSPFSSFGGNDEDVTEIIHSIDDAQIEGTASFSSSNAEVEDEDSVLVHPPEEDALDQSFSGVEDGFKSVFEGTSNPIPCLEPQKKSIPVPEQMLPDFELEHGTDSESEPKPSKPTRLGMPFDLDSITQQQKEEYFAINDVPPALEPESIKRSENDDKDATLRGRPATEDIDAEDDSVKVLVKPKRLSQVPSYNLGPQILRKSRSPSRSPERSPVQPTFQIPELKQGMIKSPIELTDLTRLEPKPDRSEMEKLRRKASLQALVEEGNRYLPDNSGYSSSASSRSVASRASRDKLKVATRNSDGESAENDRSGASSPELIGSLRLKQHLKLPSLLGEGFQSPDNEDFSLRSPMTPTLQLPQKSLEEHLDEKINSILTTLPSKVRLTAQNLKKLERETPVKRNPNLLKGQEVSHIPGPKSVVSNVSSTASGIPYAKGTKPRQYSGQINSSDHKVYHLHRDGQKPIKLLVRLVGAGGERVMVRVGGGWADLAEYLREYIIHHGSGRRAVSTTFDVQDISKEALSSSNTLHPPSPYHSVPQRSPSAMSIRSPTPSVSRPSSPLPPSQPLNAPKGPKAQQSSGRLQAPTATGFGRGGRPESPMFGRRGAESPLPGTTPVTMRGGHNGGLLARPGTATGHRQSTATTTTTPISSSITRPTAASANRSITPASGGGLNESKYAHTPATPALGIGRGGIRTTSTSRLQEYSSPPPTGPRGGSRPASAQGHYRQGPGQAPSSPHLSPVRSGSGQAPSSPLLSPVRPSSSHRPGSSSGLGSNATGLSSYQQPHQYGRSRSNSRLSFGETIPPAAPLGLAGPKGKVQEISPEKQAWVDGMLGQVRKVSVGRQYPPAIVDEDGTEDVPAQVQRQRHQSRFRSGSGAGPSPGGGGGVPTGPAAMQQQGGMGNAGDSIAEMSKAGNTRRVYVKRGSFASGREM